jgi:RNA 3'-terminal phosphate cyclase
MSMLEIDGARQSGSGTIVRYAVALAALLGRSVRIFNARKRRRSPGLRPQHVTSILACAALCSGDTEGVSVDSTEFTFVPGPRLAGGTYNWDISTAGSTTMLAFSVLPLACFADQPVRARIEGGMFQDYAPSPYHLQHVLAANVDLKFFREESYRRISRAGLQPVLGAILYHALGVGGSDDARHSRPQRFGPGVVADCGLRSVDPEVPWHVSQFYPTYKMVDRPETPVATVRRARQAGLNAGLRRGESAAVGRMRITEGRP